MTYYFIENVTYTNFDNAYKALSEIVIPNAFSALGILQILGGNTMKHLQNVITNMVNSGYVWSNKTEIVQLLPYNTKLYVDAVPKEGEVIPADGYGVNFTVGTVNEVTNTFVLTLGKFTDEAYGVELPAYVREELITTLKGEW